MKTSLAETLVLGFFYLLIEIYSTKPQQVIEVSCDGFAPLLHQADFVLNSLEGTKTKFEELERKHSHWFT
jgi:hypothetical protein